MDEFTKRQRDAENTGTFGVSFLDDALNGIRPTELVIIGARTGAGKTELALRIAMANAKKERNVWMFALEAEEFEMKRRIKYQMLARLFFADRASFPKDIRLNFTDWLHRRYGEKLEVLEHFVNEKYEEHTAYLNIITPSVTEFTKKDFGQLYLEAVDKGVDMIILDHIHYIASDDREGEYEHIKRTMWRIRDLVNKHEVPIVAFSHLRKEDRKAMSIVPTIDELHGSSEISKQANHVISLGPIYKLPKKQNPQEFWESLPGTTGFRVLKTRTGHAGCSSYIGVLNFDFERNAYEERYVPYRTDRWSSQMAHVGYEGLDRWMGMAREAAN